MKKAIDYKAGTVTFTFDDGLEPVVCDAGAMSESMGDYCVLFGINHRVGDNAALSRTGKDGKVITVTEAMRREAVLEMWNHMKTATIGPDGEGWNMKASARRAPQNPVIAAIAAKRGITYEQAEAELAKQFLSEV